MSSVSLLFCPKSSQAKPSSIVLVSFRLFVCLLVALSQRKRKKKSSNDKIERNENESKGRGRSSTFTETSLYFN